MKDTGILNVGGVKNCLWAFSIHFGGIYLRFASLFLFPRFLLNCSLGLRPPSSSSQLVRVWLGSILPLPIKVFLPLASSLQQLSDNPSIVLVKWDNGMREECKLVKSPDSHTS